MMRVTVLTPCSLDRTKHNGNIRRLAAAAVKRATVHVVMQQSEVFHCTRLGLIKTVRTRCIVQYVVLNV